MQLENPHPNEENRPIGINQKYTEAKVIEILETGDVFGEIAVFSNLKRTATVRSTEVCIFHTINKKSIKKIEKRFP